MNALRRIETPVICAVLVAVTALLGSLGPSSIDATVVSSLCFVFLTVAFYAFSGISGVVSFGQLAFAAVGGYVVALTTLPSDVKRTLLKTAPNWLIELGAPTLVAVLVSGLVAAIVAAIVAVPLMRLSGLTAGLATVALLFIAQTVARGWTDITRGPRGLASVPATTDRNGMLLWVLACLVVVGLYQTSRWGIRLRASSDDENAARAIGISVPFERGIAFVLGGFLMGCGGALYVQYLGTIVPDLFFIDLTFTLIAMAVLGGISSMSGVVVGAIIVSVIREVLRRAEAGSLLGLVDVPARPGLSEVGIAVVLVVVLRLRPSGILAGREFTLPRRRAVTTPNDPSQRSADADPTGENTREATDLVDVQPEAGR